MNIYVGNLSFDVTEKNLRKKFEPHGKVNSVTVVKDRVSGRGLGLAFVEMPGHKQAQEAIDALNRTKIKDRVVIVSETKAHVERRQSQRK